MRVSPFFDPHTIEVHMARNGDRYQAMSCASIDYGIVYKYPLPGVTHDIFSFKFRCDMCGEWTQADNNLSIINFNPEESDGSFPFFYARVFHPCGCCGLMNTVSVGI